MPIIDDDKGILDYEADAVSAPQGLREVAARDQDLEEARKALFEHIEVVENGEKRRERVLGAILETWSRSAAQGNAHAIEYNDKISEHRQRQHDRAIVTSAFRYSPVRALEAAHAPIATMANNLSSFIALQMMPCFIKVFETLKGPITISASLFPYYLDPEPALKAITSFRRRERRTRPQGHYEIGKGKPPIATRFTADRNPRRKGKPYDAFALIDASRNKPVMVTTATGKQVKTRRAVGYANLFRDAARGNRRASVITCKIIINLDEKGMLSPPNGARRRRKGRSEQSARHQMLMNVVQAMAAPAIKRDLLVIFERRYGKIPDFTTAYERRLTPLEEIDGWKEIQAERDAACAAQEELAEKTASELARRDAREEPVLVAPTRKRTRAAQVSAPARSAPASPPQLPRANKPIVQKVRGGGRSKGGN